MSNDSIFFSHWSFELKQNRGDLGEKKKKKKTLMHTAVLGALGRFNICGAVYFLTPIVPARSYDRFGEVRDPPKVYLLNPKCVRYFFEPHSPLNPPTKAPFCDLKWPFGRFGDASWLRACDCDQKVIVKCYNPSRSFTGFDDFILQLIVK